MTEILLDITRLVGRLLKGRLPTGIDRVDLAYVAHYGPRARAVVQVAGRLVPIAQDASQRVFARLLDRRQRLRWSVLGELLGGAVAGASEPLPRHCVYLNTGHSGLHRPATMNRLHQLGAQPVFMVHDLIPITHHEYCRAGQLDLHETRMRTVLDTAAAVLVNSRATLADLAQFAAGQQRPLPPATVVPLAPGLAQHAPGPAPLAQPYFLVVSTIEPRKNLAFLLQVWRRLAEQHGDHTPRLVLVGQRGWECENVVDLLERCEPLRGLVIERGNCGDAELATLLHHAQALLLPSFVEGFGLPLVEALAAGTPVIASDLPVFREIAGAIPEYADPLDGPAWLRLIEDYAAPQGAARAAQLARMQGFAAPDWRDHFRAVDVLVDSLLRGAAAAPPLAAAGELARS